MNDLHTGGILPVVYSRDYPATWSTGVHSIGQGFQVYDTLLEEFPEGHGDTVDNEHHFEGFHGWQHLLVAAEKQKKNPNKNRSKDP